MTPTSSPLISLIVAMDQNRLIGANGRLPSWHLPDDVAWFKEKTIGKPVIMGRKTYESIPSRFRPLPQRKNIVLTRNKAYQIEETTGDAVVCHTPADALAAAGDAPECVVIGGAAVYELFWPQTKRLYLTEIEATFDGDTYFPAWDKRDFTLTYEQFHPVDARHAHPFRFQIWERS